MKEEIKQLIDSTLNISHKTLNVLGKILEELRNFFEVNILERNKIIASVQNFNSTLQKEILEFKTLMNENEKLNIDIVENKHNQLQELNKSIRQQLNQSLQVFKSNIYINYLLREVSEINEKDLQIKNTCEKFKFHKPNGFKINGCQAFTLNSNTTILYAGFENGKVKAYGFNSKNKLIKLLPQCLDNSLCLLYIKSTNQLASGSYSSSIAVWDINQNSYQILEGHTNHVYNIITNQLEDLLISGAYDGMIKFWKKTNQKWLYFDRVNVKFKVIGLSLSDSEKKLITCGLTREIIVIEYMPSQTWAIIQAIKIDHYGLLVNFINDNYFLFQPYITSVFGTESLYVYQFEQGKKQFIKTNQVLLQSSSANSNGKFQCQLFKEKNIIVIKYNRYINFIEFSKNGELQLKQVVEFKDSSFYGRLTQDGQYLIIWDPLSQQIQVSKATSLI